MKIRPHISGKRQRGAATLVVVMILFFIMAMMAAYANRNLIFEQRIASNYYRSGLALEVAEGGAEWALNRLNGINLDASCIPADDPASTNPTNRFVQRYFNINTQSRVLTALSPTATAPEASCVRTAGQGWACQCAAANTAVAAPNPTSAQTEPSFAVYLAAANRAGIVRITSLGCTSTDPALCRSANQAIANAQLLGSAVVRTEAAFVSALKVPPATPLTVGQTVIDGAAALGLHNVEPQGSGMLLVAGGAVAGTVLSDTRLDSLPGTPGRQGLVVEDTSTAAARTAGQMFELYFGMGPTQYQNQPATRIITCPNGDCMPTLLTAFGQGVRMAWINGPLTLATNNVLGTAANPMVVIATGAVTITSPMVINGLLYSQNNISWTNNSGQPALLNGAVVSEGTFTAGGTVDISYNAGIIYALSNATGSFVRVPGSWWDAGGGF